MYNNQRTFSFSAEVFNGDPPNAFVYYKIQLPKNRGRVVGITGFANHITGGLDTNFTLIAGGTEIFLNHPTIEFQDVYKKDVPVYSCDFNSGELVELTVYTPTPIGVSFNLNLVFIFEENIPTC